MKERPILFSAAMVRAILEGRKTQTRRVAKLVNGIAANHDHVRVWQKDHAAHMSRAAMYTPTIREPFGPIACPYGVPGDRLWVRETWGVSAGYDSYAPRALTPHVHNVWYKAGGGFDFENGEGGIIRPSIFMPRWASRITLEITDVRVQRVQEIRAADAIAEGIEPVVQMGAYQTFKNYGPLPSAHMLPVDSFHSLWDSINGKTHPWARNEWVWALTFKVLP